MRNKRYFYEKAQICCNGHVITTHYVNHPEQRRERCPQCGAITIHECPHCKAPIDGCYHEISVTTTSLNVLTGAHTNRANERCLTRNRFQVPSHCRECGEPYPWTQKTLSDTANLIENEMSELTSDEQADFKSSLPNIMFETSETKLSAERIAKYLGKVSSLAKEGFKHNVFNLASECAKRLIWPP